MHKKKQQEEQEPEGLKNTVQIRLYPTRTQARMLREHCQEYIDCVNVIVEAYDAEWKAAWDRLIWKAMIPKVKAIEGELNRNPLHLCGGDLSVLKLVACACTSLQPSRSFKAYIHIF